MSAVTNTLWHMSQVPERTCLVFDDTRLHNFYSPLIFRRGYGLSSYEIHLKQCKAKWEATQQQLPLCEDYSVLIPLLKTLHKFSVSLVKRV